MEIPSLMADNYKLVEEINHPALDLLYPRKLIDVPQDYCHPKHLAPLFVDSASIILNGNTEDQTRNALYFVCCRLAKYGVPTYLADYNFLHAITRSKTPANYPLANLYWPFPALLFCIPEKFGLEYIGKPIHFLAGMKRDAKEPIVCPVDIYSGRRIPLSMPRYDEPEIYMVATCVESSADKSRRLVATYSNMQPIKEGSTISDLATDPIRYFGNLVPELAQLAPMNFDQVADTEIVNRLTYLFIQILLAMTAVPQFVKLGGMVVPARTKHGRTKRALYRANWVGQGYRLVRERTTPTGTHASPEMHWRIGHWRRQHFGPENKQEKLIWIEPVLVNAPD